MIKCNLFLLPLAAMAAAPAGAQLVGQAVSGLGQTIGSFGQTVGNTVGGATGSGTERRLPPRLVETATAPGQALQTVMAPIGRVTSDAALLNDLRRLRHAELIRAHPAELESGEKGVPVRRGRVLLVDPSATQLAAAARSSSAPTAAPARSGRTGGGAAASPAARTRPSSG